MPEGPELRLAANFINKIASQHLFSGKVIKSDLATKLTEVPFEVRSSLVMGKSLTIYLDLFFLALLNSQLNKVTTKKTKVIQHFQPKKVPLR